MENRQATEIIIEFNDGTSESFVLNRYTVATLRRPKTEMYIDTKTFSPVQTFMHELLVIASSDSEAVLKIFNQKLEEI